MYTLVIVKSDGEVEQGDEAEVVSVVAEDIDQYNLEKPMAASSVIGDLKRELGILHERSKGAS